MNDPIFCKAARELRLRESQIAAVSALLDAGATIPFIARYRKEVTGSLDEVAVSKIRDATQKLRKLEERRDFIIRSLADRCLLTPDLSARLQAADTLAALEDIYLPYRPRRRTRAVIAREKGLAPLAKAIFAQDDINIDPLSEGANYIDPQKGVLSADDAVAGARDIIAEWVSEDPDARFEIRKLFEAEGILKSRAVAGKEAEAGKYRDYLDWSEPLSKAPSHRFLAMQRAAKDGIISLHLSPPEEMALEILEGRFVKGSGPSSAQVKLSARDGYKRLLAPSMETEILAEAKAAADEKAISIFADNLRQLLLEAPLGQKTLLAVDPGFRTGCKIAVLDRLGRLVHSDVIYPNEPQKMTALAKEVIMDLCKRYEVEAIAIGNGTAGRETEEFLRRLPIPEKIPVIMVNEAGASVYSASQAARDEFPDQDLTVRGAISIGRRLMDPLSELVKIPPQAIGVGQYQHDVDQNSLGRKLDDVVSSCVNMVGVDANTASRELLSYVSGLGPKLADAIVKYRNEHGRFNSRKDLLKVSRFGPKAFEQAAGFLRIRDGDNPLDASAVHPESYEIVERMAADLGVPLKDLINNCRLLERIDLSKYITDRVGMPTLCDIAEELSRPGRDPRREFEAFKFSDVDKIEDLKPGMKLPGIVTNVTAFGAFVDVGVHQDGLVHISQLSDRFVASPSEIVKARQKVMVTVLDVDLERKRISLSMKASPQGCTLQ